MCNLCEMSTLNEIFLHDFGLSSKTNRECTAIVPQYISGVRGGIGLCKKVLRAMLLSCGYSTSSLCLCLETRKIIFTWIAIKYILKLNSVFFLF